MKLLTGPRQNDVALAIGSLALCAAIGLATYMRGIVLLAHEQQQFIDIIARVPSGEGYLAAKQAINIEDARFISQHCLRAEPVSMVVIGVVLCAVGISIAVVNNVTTPLPSDKNHIKKGSWATGVPLLAYIPHIAGTAMIAWGAGILTYACGDVVEPSRTVVEAMAISAGVLGAIAIACFIADYVFNKDRSSDHAK